MEYVLAERWISNIKIPNDSQIVALTPEAIYLLEKCGLAYSTLEDFYSSPDVRGDVDKFLLEQLQWFDRFDRKLGDLFSDCPNNLRLATTYYYSLKYLTDNVILCAKILEKFLDLVQVEKIYFIDRVERKGAARLSSVPMLGHEHPYYDALDNSFKHGRTPLSQIIELLCIQRDIGFERLKYKSVLDPFYENTHKNKPTRVSRTISIRNSKNYLVDGFHRVTTNPRFVLWRISKRRRFSKGSVFVLSGARSLVLFLKDIKNYGYTIQFRYGLFSGRSRSTRAALKRLDSFDKQTHRKILEETAFSKLMESEILSWVNEQSNLNVSSVLESRFRFFVFDICPVLIKKVKDYVDQYDQDHIKLVVAANIWSVDDHAAVAACRLSSGTSSIGFAHGSDAYECKSRFFYMDRQYDFFITPSQLESEHEDGLRKYFQYDYPKVLSFPYIFQKDSYKSRDSHNECDVLDVGGRKLVLFVPIIYDTDPGRSFQKNQPFPMEYVNWHRQLATCFFRLQEFFFIWKGRIQPGQNFELMSSFINDNDYSNVRFDSGTVDKWIPQADRIICDIPSTVFFESIYAGKPTIALYRRNYQLIRKNAKKTLGCSLQEMTTTDEGLAIVKKFLFDRKEKYIVPAVPQSPFDVSMLS